MLPPMVLTGSLVVVVKLVGSFVSASFYISTSLEIGFFSGTTAFGDGLESATGVLFSTLD